MFAVRSSQFAVRSSQFAVRYNYTLLNNLFLYRYIITIKDNDPALEQLA